VVKIENPLTKMKTKNKFLKILVLVMLVALPTTYYYQGKNFEEYYHSKTVENKKLKILDANRTKELEETKKQLEKKEKELKKFVATKENLKRFIAEKNPSLPEHLTERYAIKIMNCSIKNGNSCNVQSVLLASESSFTPNPKHAIPAVLGMGGIYTTVWSDELKKEGIIKSNKDLLDPMINIEASSYILSVFMKSSPTTFIALAKYKGYSKLGKSQAAAVLKMATQLKAREQQYA
jgi:hypothetical protein